MTIRPATADDLAEVAALDGHLFGPDAWSDSQVAEELVGEHRAAWIAQAAPAGPVVGYVITRTVGEVSDLQRIAVRPDHRRRGLAGRLLAEALGRARADGAQRMLLEVSAENLGALAFYRTAGFAEIGRRRGYYRDGTDAVVMAVATG